MKTILTFPLFKMKFLVLFLILPFWACREGNGQVNAETGKAIISGKIEKVEGWSDDLVLVKPMYYSKILADYEMKVLGSISTDEEGKFNTEVEIPKGDSGLYFLMSQKVGSKFKNKMESFPWMENYIGLFLVDGEEIKLTAKLDELSSNVNLKKANAQTKALKQLHDLRTPLAEEIKLQFDTTADKKTFQWSLHGNENIEKSYHANLDGFLDTTQMVVPAFVAMRMRETDNEFRDNPEFFIEVKNRLRNLAPNHPWHEQVDYYFQKDKLPLLRGEQMPDFALPSLTGDTLRLSDVKGKLIIADFWASWCAPCRKEAKETLLPLYNKWHEKGLEIVGISIDADEKSWRRAIEKDGSAWLHGCDFLGDASPVRQSLKFEYIPSLYVLDENKILLARSLHGEELVQFVENYFKNDR
jgi:thiol-disulfide isomerase/thioredoxin